MAVYWIYIRGADEPLWGALFLWSLAWKKAADMGDYEDSEPNRARPDTSTTYKRAAYSPNTKILSRPPSDST